MGPVDGMLFTVNVPWGGKPLFYLMCLSLVERVGLIN
jgi:hypothetical protein